MSVNLGTRSSRCCPRLGASALSSRPVRKPLPLGGALAVLGSVGPPPDSRPGCQRVPVDDPVWPLGHEFVYAGLSLRLRRVPLQAYMHRSTSRLSSLSGASHLSPGLVSGVASCPAITVVSSRFPMVRHPSSPVGPPGDSGPGDLEGVAHRFAAMFRSRRAGSRRTSRSGCLTGPGYPRYCGAPFQCSRRAIPSPALFPRACGGHVGAALPGFATFDRGVSGSSRRAGCCRSGSGSSAAPAARCRTALRRVFGILKVRLPHPVRGHLNRPLR